MKTLAAYQIEDLGADHTQYFPGVTAAHSDHPSVILGSGFTPQEALDDAIEQLASEGVNTAPVKDKLSDEGDIPLIEEGEGDEESPDGSPHPEWRHYVAIFYILKGSEGENV